MKLKEVGALAIRYSGIPLLVRHVVAGAQASIVVYHDPAPEVVERHLDYLSRRYRFIPLGELVEAIRSRDWGRIPRRSLVITLDDGHAGNAALAPVFRKYGVRPTIFLCSQIVATRRRFWFHVGDGSLKRLPNAARLRRLGEEHGFAPEREYPNASREALSAADLASLGEWADIGSHTRFHPILTTCDDDECEEEIARSRREIEQATGRACLHFPFGNAKWRQARPVGRSTSAGTASRPTRSGSGSPVSPTTPR